MRTERILMGGLIAAVALGCGVILLPFLSAILWAAILAFTTWPVHQALRDRLRLGRVGAASLMVAVTAIVVVLPLAIAAPGSAGDVARLEKLLNESLAGGLPLAPTWVFDIPMVGPTTSDLWNRWAQDISAMAAFFRPYFGIAAQFGLRLLLGLANGVLEFLLALFVAFFLFASGEELARRLQILMRRIAGEAADRLLGVVGETVRGVVYGILGTAIVQGLLTAFGLWISGVPQPALLGVVAGGLSVLPVGAPVVWIPAGLWLLSTGSTFWGIFLLAWGGLVISTADNVIRPYFIARGARLPFLLTMLGVLGGAIAFGLLGIFVGPVLLAVGYTLVAEWSAEQRPAGHQGEG